MYGLVDTGNKQISPLRGSSAFKTIDFWFFLLLNSCVWNFLFGDVGNPLAWCLLEGILSIIIIKKTKAERFFIFLYLLMLKLFFQLLNRIPAHLTACAYGFYLILNSRFLLICRTIFLISPFSSWFFLVCSLFVLFLILKLIFFIFFFLIMLIVMIVISFKMW